MTKARIFFQILSFLLFIACMGSLFISNSSNAADSKPSTELSEEEKRIKSREEELDKKIKELERLRADVSGELDKQKKDHEEHLLKLVSVYETMTPKSASGVFESMDDLLAVDLLKRMDIKKVAKIMNLLNKDRSAKLSELLTGYYRPSTTVGLNSNSQGQAAPNSAVASAPEKTTVRSPAAQAAGGSNQTKGGENKNDKQSTRSRKGSS